MSELAKGWVETTLEYAGKWGSGGTPKRGISKYYGGTIPWIKSGDLTNGEIVTNDEYITKEGLENSSAKLFPEGTISIAMYGATIGKLGIFTYPASTNQACGNVKAHSGINNKFIFYFLAHEKEKLIHKGKGGAQPNISQEVIKAHPFKLPPRAEQDRIVAKLDSIFSELNEAKTRLNRVPELLKKFRQSVLDAACTGKLTEEWRETHKKLERRNINSKACVDFKTASSRVLKRTIPESWSMSSLGDYVSNLEAGKNFRCPEIPVTKETVGLVKISSVTWGKFNHKETKTVTDQTMINERLMIKEGDFLISRANTIELVGASVVVDQIDYRIMISDKVWRIEFSDISKHFVDLYLKSKFGRSEIESRATGNQQSMRNLSQNEFKNINIPVMPKEEEGQIVIKANMLLKLADDLQDVLDITIRKFRLVNQSILKQAFEGRLVNQDPADEPASVLLERIKAQRAAPTSKKKPTKKS